MNQLATSTERLPMDSVGMASTGTGAKIAPQNLAEVVKFAEVMCRADIALPKHLRGNAGACMAVALQALDWEMNPFAVASKSYSVNGQIAYEAQLIVAVVNTRSGIEGRITYRFEGEGADRVCIASGKLDGETLEVRSPKFKDITPKNSPLWKSDPDQQQCYYTGRSWARRFTPEVILGVYDRDELVQAIGPDHAKDITPESPVMARLRAQSATQEPQDEQEGFSRSFVADQTDEPLTGEILDNTNTGEDLPASTVDDAGSAPASGGDGIAAQSSSPSSSPAIPAEYRQHFIDFARKALTTANETGLPENKRNELLEEMNLQYRVVIPQELWGKLSAIKLPALYVVTGQRTKEKVASYIAVDLLDCSVEEIGG